MIEILACIIAYTVKGGQFPVRFGKALSAGLIFAFVVNDTNDILTALYMTAAWLLAVAPSMGEEAGAIGRTDKWWGDYKDAGFTRSYGILKGLQRGAWMGAVFTVAGATTLSIPIMAIGFPLAHFIGQEIYYRLHRKDSWAYAEPIVGALIGLCYALSRGI